MFKTVGFSSGLKVGNKRIPLQFVYINRLALISDNYTISLGIDDDIYKHYKEKIKREVPKAFDHLMGNRVEIHYESISKVELESILAAAVEIAKQMKED